MKHRHEMPFGAALRSTGGVDFALWAPAARTASVYCGLDHSDPTREFPAQRGVGGWWHCDVASAGGGALYQWKIDGELPVPDPASRYNPDGPHGPSRVEDALAFDWDDDGWTGRPWHEVVLYELHVGTFTPEGTFAAAAQKLPYLAALGITAVELMPVASFAGRFGWGYDGVLPYAPHAHYGDPDALKSFVQSAHRLGLMVFMDVVYNHFGPDGNYLGRYAPLFFSEKHTSPWGAAINFDGAHSDTVRAFFIHNALYWIHEFRMDGLRLDAVHAIVDNSRPDFVEELSARVREATTGRHVHLVLENEKNQHLRLAPNPVRGRFDAQWNDDFHHAIHVLLTGETQAYFADYASSDSMDLLGRALTYGFVFEESERGAGGARRQLCAAPALPLGAMVNYLNNHDQTGNRAYGERMGRLLAADGPAQVALLLSLLTPATPMLFFGDELGASTPFLYFADWQGALADAVREGRQREFGHAAGAGGAQTAALPDPCSRTTFTASAMPWSEAASARGQTFQTLVREALAVRRQWIAPRQEKLATGEHTARRVGQTGLQVCWRYTDGAQLWLEANLGAMPLHGSEPATAAYPTGTALRNLYACNRSADEASWPAWSALWRLREPQ